MNKKRKLTQNKKEASSAKNRRWIGTSGEETVAVRMVNVLARSPGNLNEVIMSQNQTVTCVVIIFCLMSFIVWSRYWRSCLVMQGYEVEVPLLCWSWHRLAVKLEAANFTNSVSACRKTCWACERQQRSKGGKVQWDWAWNIGLKQDG